MLTLKPTTKFKKDVKKAHARGYKIKLLNEVLDQLASGEPLAAKNHDHPLIGSLIGCRECHITLDWLLIYEIDEAQESLYLLRTGTHSDLFQI